MAQGDFDINVTVHSSAEILERLDRIEGLLHRLIAKENTVQDSIDQVTAAIQDLADAVAAETTTDGSVATLISGITKLQTANAGNAVALHTLAATIRANIDTLNAAVAAGTPAASVPPAPVTPVTPVPVDTLPTQTTPTAPTDPTVPVAVPDPVAPVTTTNQDGTAITVVPPIDSAGAPIEVTAPVDTTQVPPVDAAGVPVVLVPTTDAGPSSSTIAQSSTPSGDPGFTPQS